MARTMYIIHINISVKLSHAYSAESNMLISSYIRFLGQS